MSASPPCPRCGRDAPLVYRGIVPQCTACGALRPPLSSPSVNFAGKPARVGGLVAGVAGWIVLLVGCAVALGLFLLFGAFQLQAIGLALAVPLAIVSLLVGALLVWRGGALRRRSAVTEHATWRDAVLGLAAHRGAVTAAEAAMALGTSVAQADAILTELAKREPDVLAIDVDDDGVVRYRIARLGAEPPVRIDASADEAAEATADEAERAAHVRRSGPERSA